MKSFMGYTVNVVEPGTIVKDQEGKEFTVTDERAVYDQTTLWVTPITKMRLIQEMEKHNGKVNSQDQEAGTSEHQDQDRTGQ